MDFHYRQGTAHSSLLCVQVPCLWTGKHKPGLVSGGWQSSEFRSTLAQAVALVKETTARPTTGPGTGTASGVWSWPLAEHRAEALLICEHAGSLLNRNALSTMSLLTPEPPQGLQGTAGLGVTPEGAKPHSLLSTKPITSAHQICRADSSKPQTLTAVIQQFLCSQAQTPPYSKGKSVVHPISQRADCVSVAVSMLVLMCIKSNLCCLFPYSLHNHLASGRH